MGTAKGRRRMKESHGEDTLSYFEGAARKRKCCHHRVKAYRNQTEERRPAANLNKLYPLLQRKKREDGFRKNVDA